MAKPARVSLFRPALKRADEETADWNDSNLNESEYGDERDEVKEIERLTKADDSRVRKMRFVVTISLLLTGAAVTISTLLFLRRAERLDFETAFQQFSSSVADSSVRQQVNLRQAYRNFASVIDGMAGNSSWPFVEIKGYEEYAHNFMEQSQLELFAFFPIVLKEKKEEYMEFAAKNYKRWMEESHKLNPTYADRFKPEFYKSFISRNSPEGFVPDDANRESYAPLQHISPPPTSYELIGWNFRSVDDYETGTEAVLTLRNETVATRIRPFAAVSAEEHDKLHSQIYNDRVDHPHCHMIHPVNRILGDDQSEIVAVFKGAMAWDVSMKNLLPDAVSGICAVIRNTCDQEFSYSIDGKDAFFLGHEDHCHRAKYEHLALHVELSNFDRHPDFESTPGHCLYSMDIYPGPAFVAAYNSKTPEVFAILVALTFLLLATIFFLFDLSVQRRNHKLISRAAHSNSLLGSMFGNFRDRILTGPTSQNGVVSKKQQLKAFVAGSRGGGASGGSVSESIPAPCPLAELFMETTILFGDIVGFTAWSSVREPTQVFQLLETLYDAFDKIAKKSKVFKVETVGDCYVAATGIPTPTKDHAPRMIRFARNMLQRARYLASQLEVTLGPDTGDLSLRIGCHSGPVTAGVLRGDRARFQLFGDTMNTASRIETTGVAGKIHVSQETADLVAESGHASWLIKRTERVQARGKGEMQTYFARIVDSEGEESRSITDVSELSSDFENERTGRLIDWNVGILQRLIEKIVERRFAVLITGGAKIASPSSFDRLHRGTANLLDEVQDIIMLPAFDKNTIKSHSAKSCELSPTVISQIHELVVSISDLYNQNSFHAFEHASHVTMSSLKLLTRIVAPRELDSGKKLLNGWEVASTLHDHTYGITSDPLTQFACAFSSLVHDAGHTGVPNAQLIKENDRVARTYHGRSVAEQNSLDLAWSLLSEDRFTELRSVICATEEEVVRFRQLVVNSVIATDISDKELKAQRNKRWEKAFHADGDGAEHEDARTVVNRKATIVIEHLIQASDVAHTMQHWHVYRKWNERLFRECYEAYKSGRADADPSEGWYKGEIAFFDFYIIPLAKKLKDCGVFGISSDEYLNYARSNRSEWEAKGRSIVDEMKATITREEGSP